MFCEKCGGELRQDKKLLICQKCGAQYGLDYSEVYSADYSAGGERVALRGFSSKKNIIIIVIAALVVLGGIGAAVAFGVSHSASKGALGGFQLAEKYLSEQNYEQAIIAFEQLLKIEPMNVDAYLGLADAYLGIGDKDKALEVMHKGLELTNDTYLQTKIDEVASGTFSSSTSATSKPNSSSAANTSTVSSSSGTSDTSKILMPEVNKIKTIDADVREFWQVGRDKEPRFVALHDNYIALIAHEEYGGGARVFRIEMDKWLNTGKISFIEVKAGDDFARGALDKCLSVFSYYSFLEITATDGYSGSFSVINTNGELLLFTTGHGVDPPAPPKREDGYRFEEMYRFEDSEFVLAVIPPEGSGVASIPIGINEWNDMIQCAAGEILGLVISNDNVYAVKKDGKLEIIDEKHKGNMGFLGRVPIWESDSGMKMLGFDGQIHSLQIDSGNDFYGYYDDNSNYIICRNIAADYQSSEYLYRAISPYNGKFMTGEYTELESLGGGRYYAATKNNGCGFIDSTDKKLAWFDLAESFLDDNRYTPVVKGGKGWLIDKSLNRVSEFYDAVTIEALHDDVFYFGSEDKKVLVRIAD